MGGATHGHSVGHPLMRHILARFVACLLSCMNKILKDKWNIPQSDTVKYTLAFIYDSTIHKKKLLIQTPA